METMMLKQLVERLTLSSLATLAPFFSAGHAGGVALLVVQ